MDRNTKAQYEARCLAIRRANDDWLWGQIAERDWFPSNATPYRRLVLSAKTPGKRVREVLLQLGDLALSTGSSLSLMSLGDKWFVSLAQSRELLPDEVPSAPAGKPVVVEGHTIHSQEVS